MQLNREDQYQQDIARFHGRVKNNSEKIQYEISTLPAYLLDNEQHERLMSLLVGNRAWMEFIFSQLQGYQQYVAGLELAIQSIQKNIPQNIVMLASLYAARHVVNELVKLIEDRDLETLIWLGRESEALNYVRLRVSSDERLKGVMTIYKVSLEKGIPNYSLLDDAEDTLPLVQDTYTQDTVISDIVTAHVSAGNLDLALTRASSLNDTRSAYKLIGMEMIKAGRFEEGFYLALNRRYRMIDREIWADIESRDDIKSLCEIIKILHELSDSRASLLIDAVFSTMDLKKLEVLEPIVAMLTDIGQIERALLTLFPNMTEEQKILGVSGWIEAAKERKDGSDDKLWLLFKMLVRLKRNDKLPEIVKEFTSAHSIYGHLDMLEVLFQEGLFYTWIVAVAGHSRLSRGFYDVLEVWGNMTLRLARAGYAEAAVLALTMSNEFEKHEALQRKNWQKYRNPEYDYDTHKERNHITFHPHSTLRTIATSLLKKGYIQEALSVAQSIKVDKDKAFISELVVALARKGDPQAIFAFNQILYQKASQVNGHFTNLLQNVALELAYLGRFKDGVAIGGKVTRREVMIPRLFAARPDLKKWVLQMYQNLSLLGNSLFPYISPGHDNPNFYRQAIIDSAKKRLNINRLIKSSQFEAALLQAQTIIIIDEKFSAFLDITEAMSSKHELKNQALDILVEGVNFFALGCLDILYRGPYTSRDRFEAALQIFQDEHAINKDVIVEQPETLPESAELKIHTMDNFNEHFNLPSRSDQSSIFSEWNNTSYKINRAVDISIQSGWMDEAIKIVKLFQYFLPEDSMTDAFVKNADIVQAIHNTPIEGVHEFISRVIHWAVSLERIKSDLWIHTLYQTMRISGWQSQASAEMALVIGKHFKMLDAISSD